jgi:hypothetical protein
MDRFLPVSEWQAAWLSRDEPTLNLASISLTYIGAATAIYFMTNTLMHVRRMKQDLATTTTAASRTHHLTTCDRGLARLSTQQYHVSCLFYLLALTIWSVDAVIGIVALCADASRNPGLYRSGIVLELAVRTVGTLVVFSAAAMLFPLLQVLCITWICRTARRRRTTSSEGGTTTPTDDDDDAVLRPCYLAGFRILATNMMQSWMLLAFMLVAFWPVLEYPIARIVSAEAVLGSALVWTHVAFMLNYHSQSIAKIQLQSPVSVRDSIKLYAGEAYALYFPRATSNTLPAYADEKQALLHA